MEQIREPAVAGTFYPGGVDELAGLVEDLLSDASPGPMPEIRPKAIIAPHAGFIYSGPVAASIYARLAPFRNTYRRVILLGPTHRYPIRGLATHSAQAFRTPLGDVPLDRDLLDRALELPQVQLLDAAHRGEHSLEVHLPFLQMVLDRFTLAPLVVGDAQAEEVASVLRALWGGDETLVVISSDLSHFLSYEEARRMDETTAGAIEALDPEGIGRDQACGRIPMAGLLLLAREEGLQVERVDLRSSGDTAGSRSQVVGYGSFLFTPE